MTGLFALNLSVFDESRDIGGDLNDSAARFRCHYYTVTCFIQLTSVFNHTLYVFCNLLTKLKELEAV